MSVCVCLCVYVSTVCVCVCVCVAGTPEWSGVWTSVCHCYILFSESDAKCHSQRLDPVLGGYKRNGYILEYKLASSLIWNRFSDPFALNWLRLPHMTTACPNKYSSTCIPCLSRRWMPTFTWFRVATSHGKRSNVWRRPNLAQHAQHAMNGNLLLSSKYQAKTHTESSSKLNVRGPESDPLRGSALSDLPVRGFVRALLCIVCIVAS